MDMKKLTAEFVGTMTLVLVGCGTAMLVGCDAASGCGYILTAFAFGLVIVGMAYCVGNVSGCHINPAVSLACFIAGRMKLKEFFAYCVAQICGAFVGTAFLWLIFKGAGIEDKTGGYGANGLKGVNNSNFVGIIVEFLLTFIFVLVILGVTSEKGNHGSFGGSSSDSRSLWFTSSASASQAHPLTLQEVLHLQYLQHSTETLSRSGLCGYSL